MSTTTLDAKTHEAVQDYYGKQLSTTEDLKTSACCTSEDLPEKHKTILSNIADEVMEKFYGCGSPMPLGLEGMTVLDLGCGSGRDVYLASALVGENGRVIGVDMTEEQLIVANKYREEQAKAFGFSKPNTEFHHGYIEELAALGIEDNSVDVVISNCVINLSPVKEKVFAEIFRVLKPGGELYFSDVFSGRRIPEELRKDPVLYGECLSGALYIEDFRRMLRNIGCLDYRVMSSRRISIDNPDIEKRAGMIDFYSMTIRAFKLDSLEDICEDFGQVAFYNGGIEDSPHEFMLDDHHLFKTGMPMLVCGNSAAMVEETRFGKYFTIIGDRSVHYGAFDCAPAESGAASSDAAPGGCC